MDPIFLEFDEVLEIHQDQIQRYGGSPGLRDKGILQSALSMPTAGFGGQYFHTDLFEMAAAYLYHIVQGHPFIDGNKRTGSATAIVFLLINGIELQANEKSFETLVRSAAQGKTEKNSIASFFREQSRIIK